MIKSLKLKNFRKHTDTQCEFTSGLQVLKGMNEVGKSSLLEAILYALLGTTVLRTSLADTATYGQSESSLKVELDITFDGVEYNITRSKSGAEINYAGGSVTGQRETRTFVENLLGCSADVASEILFADQNAVRGILTAGPSAAGSLVEKLAGLEQLESLIAKIQDTLPYGSTSSLAGQLASAEEQSLVEPEKPSDAPLAAAQEAVDSAALLAQQAQVDLELLLPKLKEAEAVETLRKAAIEANQKVEARKRNLAAVQHPGAPVVTRESLRLLELEEEGMEERAYRVAAKNTVFPTTKHSHAGDAASLQALIAVTEAGVTEANRKIREASNKYIATKAMRINEKSCSFCKKDLTDIPEVLALNTKTDADLSSMQASLDVSEYELDKLNKDLTLLRELEKVSARIRQLANPRYWSLTDSVPPKPIWIGGDTTESVERVDISALKRSLNIHEASLRAWEQAQLILETLTLTEVPEQVYPEVRKQHKEAVDSLHKVEGAEKQARNKLRMVEVDYAADYATYEAALRAKEVACQQVLRLRFMMTEMVENNELVKKLRSLRPQIATKLWGMVLHAVSHYFTQIRGVTSVVARDDSGFKVDGRNVTGLSGSTLDSLGLAIRLALSRLFLPNVGFMFLDEPASGCDEARELAMLGMVASSGVPQVLLVTHSSLADSLSQNLIQL